MTAILDDVKRLEREFSKVLGMLSRAIDSEDYDDENTRLLVDAYLDAFRMLRDAAQTRKNAEGDRFVVVE